MFQWIRSWFLEQFGFLIDGYGFQCRHTNLGDWLDRNGKPLFSGPLYVYQFYTEKVCLNLLYLVQRDEYYGYLTEKQRNDQLYIRKGDLFSRHYIKKSSENPNSFCIMGFFRRGKMLSLHRCRRSWLCIGWRDRLICHFRRYLRCTAGYC